MINLDTNLKDIISEGRTQEEYLSDYNEIISNAKSRGLDRSILDGYYEIHHDIPRSIRPDLIREESNLTALTAKEHIVCHILLYRIYPNNDKIIAAADCMLGCHLMCNNTNEREAVIREIDIDLISELREKVLRRLSKKIVAFTIDDGKLVIHIILDSVHEAIYKYGYTAVRGALKSHNKCGKYFWEYLNNFIEQYPKEYSEYIEKVDNGFIPEIEVKPKVVSEEQKKKRKDSGGKVVCLDPKTKKIVKIYKNQSSAEEDGFLVSAVSKSITSGTETRGYLFKFLSEVRKEDIDEFNNLSESPKIKLKTDEIVCYDLYSTKIHKIYKNLREVSVDGFMNTSVCSVLKSDDKKYRGYRWEYLYNWTDEKALDDYYKTGGESIIKQRLKSDPQKIVKSDLELNVVGIYKNLHNVPGYDYRLLSVIINRENNVYTKDPAFRWFRYEDFELKYPEKLKEYESRNTDIDNSR